jgi:hypothetical protein
MRITCHAARTIAEWPTGTKFRVNSAVLYTKIGDGNALNTFRVKTFRDGKEREVSLTVQPSDTITLVRFPA